MNSENTPLRTRREFLRTSALGAAAAWTVPVFLERTFSSLHAQAADSPIQTATGKDSPILVVIQLAGGNDGLNSVVPFADDAYYAARPSLAVRKSDLLVLNDYCGLNKTLMPFKQLYDDGLFALIHGVGYPNPNRSHFRSTEIWHTATDSHRSLSTGWIGRYFDNACQGCDPTVGVSIGNETPLALVGKQPTGVSFSEPEQFTWKSNSIGSDAEELFMDLNAPDDDAMSGATIGSLGGASHGGDTMDFLQRTALDAQVSSQKILAITKTQRNSASYPSNRLGSSLSLVARMIAGGLPTRVYYVSQGGYDTHSNQTGTHDRLLTELALSIAAFVKDLKAQGNLNRTLLMTFSEFGRRMAENGSAGTDHGAAAPLFIVGGGIHPGLYGAHPSLTGLDHGDLVHTTDFRSVYATVLEKWLRTDSKTVLGRRFQTLEFV
jgi:uncharacterized protein (DUF1501 family)